MTTDAWAALDEYVNTLLQHFAAKLTEWEDGFLRDVQRKRKAGVMLHYSPRQERVVNDIMERCAREHQ